MLLGHSAVELKQEREEGPMKTNLVLLLLALVGAGGVVYALVWSGATVTRVHIDVDDVSTSKVHGSRFGWPRHWLHPDDQKTEHNRALKITRGWKDRAARKERWRAFWRWLVPWKRRG